MSSLPILDTNYPNPPFNTSSSTWARDVVHGKTFLSGLTGDAPFQWTQVLNPNDENDLDLVGLSGTAIKPDLSNDDTPFTHPFGFDWEFYIAPDSIYQSLAAPSNDNLYVAAKDAAKNDFGIQVPNVIGVEADQDLVPEGFRVQHGNRVCVWGRWIVDAGHNDFHSEIHPHSVLVGGHTYRFPPVPSAQIDATMTTIVGRPYLVGQTFGDGALKDHLLKEVAKVETFRSGRIEAHPKILPQPFTGTHLISYTVRPPRPRNDPKDRLMARFHFTTRTGVEIQVSNAGDSVTVFVTMNATQYTPPPLPQRHDVSITLSELKKQNATAGKVYEGIIFGSLLINPVFAPIVLSLGILTDRYDPPIAKSPHDQEETRVPVDSLLGNTPHAVDDGQPFPIYGYLALEWERAIAVVKL